MTALKQFLLGLMLLGAVTYFGGGGTWASFNAETSNNGSSISSGTLTMSDQVNSAGACFTASSATANNVANCPAPLTIANVAPGNPTSTATITVMNTGSIDGSSLTLFGSYTNGMLNAPLTSGNPVTTLSVTNLEGPVNVNDTIVVANGPNTQSFSATSAAVPVTPPALPSTAVSFTVQKLLSAGGGAVSANATYPAGSTTVTDTSSNSNGSATAANNTDCYDRQTAGGTPTATKGDSLNFNPIVGNPFCSHALMYVQETTGGKNYCWYGATSVPGAATGLCAIPPIGMTVSTIVPLGAVSSIPITSMTLNGNISVGDTITVTSGTHTQNFVSAQNIAYGTTGVTSITITGSTVTTAAFPVGSTVVDLTATNAANSDILDTITNFDTSHGSSGRLQLAPISSSGILDATAPVQLAHGASRVFLIGLYMPSPAGTNQNYLQGLQSIFGLTWHLDQ
jgi:hypothetical protein